MENISRREFNNKVMTAGALPVFSVIEPAVRVFASPGTSKWIEIKPGSLYDLVIPQNDSIKAGTRWKGGLLQSNSNKSTTTTIISGPLEPMYRKRLILKLDDLADWCFPSWRRYISVVERSGGKADLGINPGICGEEVWEWLRSLDKNRFEIWNHTWDHGSKGTLQFGHTYDIQLKHLNMAHHKVKEELGITMRAFGIPGIRPYPDADNWIGDGDVITYYVVRNNPDYIGYFEADQFADSGLGKINSANILTPDNPIDFEHPDQLNSRPETRDYTKKYFVQSVKDLYPDEEPNRVCGVGNPEELFWRIEHPYKSTEKVAEMEAVYIQCHPWNWATDRGLESVAAWISYVRGRSDWRLSNYYEAYKWLKDKDLIILEKTSPNNYRLDAHNLHFSHMLELSLPSETKIRETSYIDPSTTGVKIKKVFL